MTVRRRLLRATLLAALVPATASAQVTPERAQAIQTQFKDWLQTTVGPAVKIEHDPVSVSAAGDHFDVTYKLGGTVGDALVTAKLTPLDGGRFALDDITLPSPTVFHVQAPPTKPGAPAGDGTVTLRLGPHQRQQALIDPSLTTPSTTSATASDFGVTVQFPTVTQASHVDNSTSHSTLTPAGNGRLDVVGEATLDGYTVKMSGADNPQATTLTVGKVMVSTTLTGLSTERGRDLIQLLAQANQTRRADKAAGTPPDARLDRTTQLALLAALSDLTTGVAMDQRFDDVTFDVRGLAGSASRVAFGLQAQSESGKLQARLPIAIGGLRLPDLGLGDMARLVPTQFSVTPHLSGVPTATLFQLARDLIVDQQPAPADMAALFQNGPIDVGIDELRLDVAGTSFAGHFGMLVAPTANTGTGQIIADNLDGLQQALMRNQATAQFAPLVILMKGMARNEGGHLVWDLGYRDSRLFVNGQDMQALMGAMTPQPRRSAPSRP